MDSSICVNYFIANGIPKILQIQLLLISNGFHYLLLYPFCKRYYLFGISSRAWWLLFNFNLVLLWIVLQLAGRRRKNDIDTVHITSETWQAMKPLLEQAKQYKDITICRESMYSPFNQPTVRWAMSSASSPVSDENASKTSFVCMDLWLVYLSMFLGKWLSFYS